MDNFLTPWLQVVPGKQPEPQPFYLPQASMKPVTSEELMMQMVPESAVGLTPADYTMPAESARYEEFKKSSSIPSAEAEYEKTFHQNMNNRQTGIDDLKAKLEKEMGNKPGMMEAANLSPLLAFADQLTGSKMAHNYTAPTATKDHQAKLQKLQDAISAQENGLSDDQLGYLKTKAVEEGYKIRQAAAERKAGDAADKATRAGEFRLREKWESNPVTKASQSMDDHFRRITGIDSNTPAGQMSMVFAYMKMLDDGSVVRESEYAQAAKTAGLYDRAAQYAESIKNGKRLTPQQIKEFQSSAESIMAEVRQKQAGLDDSYKNLAQDYGFNPERVVYGVSFKEPKSKGKPPGKQASAMPDFDNMNPEDLNKYLGQ